MHTWSSSHWVQTIFHIHEVQLSVFHTNEYRELTPCIWNKALCAMIHCFSLNDMSSTFYTFLPRFESVRKSFWPSVRPAEPSRSLLKTVANLWDLAGARYRFPKPDSPIPDWFVDHTVLWVMMYFYIHIIQATVLLSLRPHLHYSFLWTTAALHSPD